MESGHVFGPDGKVQIWSACTNGVIVVAALQSCSVQVRVGVRPVPSCLKVLCNIEETQSGVLPGPTMFS